MSAVYTHHLRRIISPEVENGGRDEDSLHLVEEKIDGVGEDVKAEGSAGEESTPPP
jgi:hypothetical protein